jgi:hypothetical protein
MDHTATRTIIIPDGDVDVGEVLRENEQLKKKLRGKERLVEKAVELLVKAESIYSASLYGNRSKDIAEVQDFLKNTEG